jgi:UDP-N-acetyl-D-mannosaminuronic acid dehydrogenase
MISNVCVLGLGYIGLPLASLLATRGLKVLGVDINPKVLETLRRGEIHIVEPDLDTLVRAAVGSGNLKMSEKPEPSDTFIICVPTPFKTGHKADLSYVERAAEAIVPALRNGNTVILESTVPPGTTRDILVPILKESGLKIGETLFVAYCPERVLPGMILRELVDNDRVVGGIDAASTRNAVALYKTFVSARLYETDCTTAEMVKLSENSYRDTNIAFANELSLVCDRLDLNVREVIRLANKHPRVRILSPGPGVGGHCIAVDPWFIVEKAGPLARLIRTAREVNDSMPEAVAVKVEKALNGKKPATIACLGLSYKADIDDVRESPAIKVVKILDSRGHAVRCHDPLVKTYNGFQTIDLKDCLQDADCAVVLVDHAVYKDLDWPAHLLLMAAPVVIDTRGILRIQNLLNTSAALRA